MFKYSKPWKQLPLDLVRFIIDQLSRYKFYCYQCKQTLNVRVLNKGLVYWLFDEDDESKKLCSVRCASKYIFIKTKFSMTDDDALQKTLSIMYDFRMFQEALDLPLIGQIKKKNERMSRMTQMININASFGEGLSFKKTERILSQKNQCKYRIL